MPRSLQPIANGYTLLPEPIELYRWTFSLFPPPVSRLPPDGVGCHDEPEATPRGRGSRTVACLLLCRPFPSTSAALTGSWLSVSAGLFSNRWRALYGNAGSIVLLSPCPGRTLAVRSALHIGTLLLTSFSWKFFSLPYLTFFLLPIFFFRIRF
ncbi:hypothetical protein BDV40DRAFT_168465 [Aspergillus tamarii]|uniref:Uncharacterized protein n=1 Tax=Aspergillus tamarii TaxID=41984 RepID=A0A5N6V9M9_ASPTM|nr:hypothetical protein BDV40DRAFT_168465 [Aspergillus tamarii]